MDGNPFELIDSPFAEGKMERWRANAMATGTMGYLAQIYEMVRNDAAELEQKTAALDAKKSAVLSTVNRLLRFMSRVDALTSGVEPMRLFNASWTKNPSSSRPISSRSRR